MGKKSRRNRPNALPPGAKSLGTVTKEQLERRMGGKVPWITPEKSEEFIKILERHPEHKTGDMSAAWREWQEAERYRARRFGFDCASRVS